MKKDMLAQHALVGDYVVLSMQRSGSTTFCSHLNAMDRTVCEYELLNFAPGHRGAYYETVLNTSIGWHAPVDSQVAFVSRVRAERCTREPCRFGYKVFPDQADDLGPLVADATCVVYKRDNVTAQYLSWKRAVSTGCWAINPDAQNATCSPWVPTVDAQELVRFRGARDAWYARVDRACAARPTIQLLMEETLLSSPPPPSHPSPPPSPPPSHPSRPASILVAATASVGLVGAALSFAWGYVTGVRTIGHYLRATPEERQRL